MSLMVLVIYSALCMARGEIVLCIIIKQRHRVLHPMLDKRQHNVLLYSLPEYHSFSSLSMKCFSLFQTFNSISALSFNWLTRLLPVLNVSKIILNVSTGFNLILNLQTVLRKQIQVYENRLPTNKMSCCLQTLMYTLLAYYFTMGNDYTSNSNYSCHICLEA